MFSEKTILESARLRLICCDQPLLEAVLKGDTAIAEILAVHIPEKWTEFGEPIFHFALEKVLANPAEVIWWAYLPILKKENTLIGTCGYVGPPDESGMVEIGYEIAENYRRMGLATEAANLLVEHAFTHSAVKTVRAHTLQAENGSVGVLKKLGFQKTGESIDPDEGPVWRWELEK